MSPKLIGISGKKRSGKDSICNILVDKFGYKKIAFADNLRNLCCYMFCLHMCNFTDDDKKEKCFNVPIIITDARLKILGQWLSDNHSHLISTSVNFSVLHDFIGTKLESPRHILQIIGTEIIRNKISASYHADVVFDTILHNPENNYCISDVRFPNERHAVRNHDGTLLLVYSSNDSTKCTHASETNIDGPLSYDLQFFNDKSGLNKLETNFTCLWDLL